MTYTSFPLKQISKTFRVKSENFTNLRLEKCFVSLLPAERFTGSVLPVEDKDENFLASLVGRAYRHDKSAVSETRLLLLLKTGQKKPQTV